MKINDVAYCENGDCRVILFHAVTDSQDVDTEKNCPACGRFGRLKDLPTNTVEEFDEVPSDSDAIADDMNSE